MYNYQRKSFDFRTNNPIEDDQPPKQLGLTSPFVKPNTDNRSKYQSNQKKYSYQAESEQPYVYRPRTPSVGGFTKAKENTTFREGEFMNSGTNNKYKRITKNYGGIGNQTFFEGDDLKNFKSRKNTLNNAYKEECSYLIEEKEEEAHHRIPHRSHTKRMEENKENYSAQPSYFNHKEDQIQESFQRINQEQILKKIGRINKLNQEINGRLQKILVKVSSSD